MTSSTVNHHHIRALASMKDAVHNGAAETEILESSVLGMSQCPSLSHSIALKMQNSTAWDWLAKSCESIFDINHSYAAGSTVTLRRILRVPLGIRGIQGQCMPNNLRKRAVMTPAEIVITGTANGGCENNEGQRFQFSDYTSLNHLCSSPSKSLTRYRQYCTACDWLAKVWSLTRDIIHWKISGSTVTLIRTLRSSSGFLGGILCDEYSRQRINNGEHNYSLVAYYATGMCEYENRAISGRCRRLEENHDEPGSLPRRERVPGRISGAGRLVHPVADADSRAGERSEETHAEGPAAHRGCHVPARIRSGGGLGGRGVGSAGCESKGGLA